MPSPVSLRRQPPGRAVGVVLQAAVGIGAIAVAVLARVPLEPILQDRNSFILLEPAIVVAALYGGMLSGLTATFAAVLVSLMWYVQVGGPPGSFPSASSGDVLSLVIFSINGILVSAISSGLRRSFDRATGARLKAEESARQSDRLQRFALALNRPMSPGELAQTALVQAIGLLGASGGIVATARADQDELIILGADGATGGAAAGELVANEAGSPLGEVMATREAVIVHGRSERQRRWPAVAAQFTREGDSVVLPLLYQGQATGAIYLNFDGPSGLGPQDREYLRSIGAQCGSALARAILLEDADVLAAKERARAAEFDAVLRAIGDGVLVGGDDGRIIMANPAISRLLGKVPPRLSDLPTRAADSPQDPASTTRYLIRSPLKPDNWLEIAHFPVAPERGSAEVILVRDVTHGVEQDRQRDAFLGVLSHELRTPITTIVAGIDLLRNAQVHGAGLGPGLLNDIDAESAKLYRIVEDLLILTRSERGALDISGEPVLVHRLVQSVVERAQLAAPEVEIRLTAADNLAPVEAEPTYVQQIARNLLSNALKYGRAIGKPIEVVVVQTEQWIETRVLDRGVGFGPGDSERLFTLFYRNPKVVRSAPGAGIGLYVCRLLAEAMGGTVWARMRPGGGAEFGFALPVISDDQEPSSVEDEERPSVPGGVRTDGLS